MKSIYIVSSLSIILLAASCKNDKWYDVKSDKSLVVPSTLKDLEAVLDNSDVLNIGSPALGEIGSDGHYLTDTRAMSLNATNKNAYTWTHDQPYVQISEWTDNIGAVGAYVRIFHANIVLDALAKISPRDSIEQRQFNNIKGQALFHRAKSFYEVSQVFAPPFLYSTAGLDMGIPLRLESDINLPSKRSTLKQTYLQVINDLLQAKNLLPITPLYKTRPSKPATFALLARAYLSIEDYENAKVAADSCLMLYNNLLDFKTLNATSTTNSISVLNEEVIFHSSMISLTAISLNEALIDPALYASYSNDDLRKVILFNRNTSNGNITYKGTYSGSRLNSPFTGLATDEVLLIRAECNARAGNKVLAMNDLNTLLLKRWKAGTFVPYTAIDHEDALVKILAERKKELLFRGLRWSDLRRLNRDPRFKTTLTRIVGGVTYTLEPNSYKYTLPIPDDIIAISGIEQNIGW